MSMSMSQVYLSGINIVLIENKLKKLRGKNKYQSVASGHRHSGGPVSTTAAKLMTIPACVPVLHSVPGPSQPMR